MEIAKRIKRAVLGCTLVVRLRATAAAMRRPHEQEERMAVMRSQLLYERAAYKKDVVLLAAKQKELEGTISGLEEKLAEREAEAAQANEALGALEREHALYVAKAQRAVESAMRADGAPAATLDRADRESGRLLVGRTALDVALEQLDGTGRAFDVRTGSGALLGKLDLDSKADDARTIAVAAIAKGLMAVPELGPQLDFTGKPNEAALVRELPGPAFDLAYGMLNDRAANSLVARIAELDEQAAADPAGRGTEPGLPTVWEARAENACAEARAWVRTKLAGRLSDLRGEIDVDAVLTCWKAA